VSLIGRGEFDFTHAANLAEQIARLIVKSGLPLGTLLNVNVPAGPIRGIRFARQGAKILHPTVVEGTDPRKRTYYWIGEETPTWNEEHGTDYEAARQGFVSITPLRNDLTDYRILDELKSGKWDVVPKEHLP
jgi:5'-nucleotidase